MSMHIYIGNVPPQASSRELHDLCQQFGTVLCVQLATDAEGRSRGYAFVEMADGASVARDVLNNFTFHGQRLSVHEAEVTKQGVRSTKCGHSMAKP